MIRAIFCSSLLVVTCLQISISAQVNNYYNAPSQYQLPGSAAMPGNTPFTNSPTQPYSQTSATTTYGAPAYGTTTYGVPAYGTTTYGVPSNGTTTYAAPSYGTTTYAAPTYGTTTYGTPTYGTPAYGSTSYGTPAYGNNYYPQPYTGPSAFPTTGAPVTNVSTAFTTPIKTSSGVLSPQPGTQIASTPQVNFTPITIPVPAFAQVDPPETWAPGLATIKDSKWTITDFLYNLPYNIGIKVVVVKPEDKYLPLSDKLLEKRVTDIFADAYLTPTPAPVTCEPPLPLYHVTIMAYPCDRRCVGVVTAQLYEVVQPQRIDQDLSGVWQAITWERQELVASSCEEFAQEIEATVTSMTQAFTWQYNRFNPIPERRCFPDQVQN